MLISGTFKDIDNNTITVAIYNRDKTGSNITIGLTELDDVYFSSDPINITTQCDDTFTHVIKRSCTISLITKIYLGDYLFANNMRSIAVNVFKNDDCIFAGYVTPNTYSQGYSNVYEQLDVECIDVLSCMQYEYLCSVNNYEIEKSQLELEPFSYILSDVGIQRNDFIVNNYPITSLGEIIWVETGFVKQDLLYYALQTKVIKLDNDAAIRTDETRIGRRLLPTLVQGSIDDTVIVDGKRHYKNYIWVTINGTDEINTGDWRVGDELADPEIVDIIWTVTGVVRETVNLYHYEETAQAVLSDGSIIYNYDTRWDDTALPYDLVYDTISNTMYSGSTEYLRRIPCVNDGRNDFYFPQDAEVGIAINSYDIIVECPTNDFRPNSGTATTVARTFEGKYIIGINVQNDIDYSMLLNRTNVQKLITVNHNYEVDCDSFCADCPYLVYARIDMYSFINIDDIFKGCTSLSNIILNMPYTYTNPDYDDFNNVPSWAMIYVQDDKVNEYDMQPYNNYTILPLSDLNILPLED